MSQQSFVRFTIAAGKEMPRDEAIELLDKTLASIRSSLQPDKEAIILLAMEASQYRLLNNDLPSVKASLNECTPLVKSLFGSTEVSQVKASFYRISAAYARAKSDFGAFYRDGMLYLACINDITRIEVGERLELAHDLVVAVLLGKESFNLGELSMHPILVTLTQVPPYTWLIDLLTAINQGDHDKFAELSKQISTHPLLSKNIEILADKLTLMSLLDLLSQKPIVTYQEIIQYTHSKNVPYLIIRASSKKLVRARMDQVKEQVEVEWVQPRALAHLDSLEQALAAWINRVDDAITVLSEQLDKHQNVLQQV